MVFMWEKWNQVFPGDHDTRGYLSMAGLSSSEGGFDVVIRHDEEQEKGIEMLLVYIERMMIKGEEEDGGWKAHVMFLKKD